MTHKPKSKGVSKKEVQKIVKSATKRIKEWDIKQDKKFAKKKAR